MNAHVNTPASPIARTADRGSAPHGVTDLARLDLSDEENVKDAAHELRRCASDHDFAQWARRWGEVAIRRASDVAGQAHDVSQDDLDEAEADAERAEDRAVELSSAISAAVEAIDKALEDAPDDLANEVGQITATLEAAL